MTPEDLPYPHSDAWYDRLSELQEGYFYPWRSVLAPGNGEDAFHRLLFEKLSAQTVALDVGCGHGELTVEVARCCKAVTGYDRVPRFIEKARALAAGAGVGNCTFVLGSSRAPTEDKHTARIPVADGRFDLIYSRRGPLHYLYDVKRVSHPGTHIVQLNPGYARNPEWASLLPREFLAYPDPGEFSILDSVVSRLCDVGLKIHSYWFFDVPEYFDSPEELYRLLAWPFLGRPPCTLAEISATLERVFRDYGEGGRVTVRHRRFLWTSQIR